VIEKGGGRHLTTITFIVTEIEKLLPLFYHIGKYRDNLTAVHFCGSSPIAGYVDLSEENLEVVSYNVNELHLGYIVPTKELLHYITTCLPNVDTLHLRYYFEAFCAIDNEGFYSLYMPNWSLEELSLHIEHILMKVHHLLESI
jgi:hypothetical protein